MFIFSSFPHEIVGTFKDKEEAREYLVKRNFVPMLRGVISVDLWGNRDAHLIAHIKTLKSPND